MVYVLLVVALVAPCPPGLLHDVVGSAALLWWALSVVPCLAGAVWLLALVPLVVVDGGASVLVGGCGPPVVWLAVPVGPLVWMVLEVAVSVVLFWDGVCCGGAIRVLSDVVVCPSLMFMVCGDWALATFVVLVGGTVLGAAGGMVFGWRRGLGLGSGCVCVGAGVAGCMAARVGVLGASSSLLFGQCGALAGFLASAVSLW